MDGQVVMDEWARGKRSTTAKLSRTTASPFGLLSPPLSLSSPFPQRSGRSRMRCLVRNGWRWNCDNNIYEHVFEVPELFLGSGISWQRLRSKCVPPLWGTSCTRFARTPMKAPEGVAVALCNRMESTWNRYRRTPRQLKNPKLLAVNKCGIFSTSRYQASGCRMFRTDCAI